MISRAPAWAGSPSWSRHAWSALTFLAGLGGAAIAQAAQRPITAAIVFLFSVTLVGAIEGVRGGLLAALTASAIYNFFLSEPVFSFSLESIDEYVPLLAFNLSAAASGLLVGRMRDRARAAEISEGRVRALLDASERLQPALTVPEILQALRGLVALEPDHSPELYVVRDGLLSAEGGPAERRALAYEMLAATAPVLRRGDSTALLLKGADHAVGVLVLKGGSAEFETDSELEAFASLVAIAVERCLLFELQAEADVVRRSEELKTALLSSVSHDMRTPLSTITASASSLALYGAQLSEETRSELLELIQEQSERLNRYTTNLLNLGRIQSGLSDLGQVRCDALDVLGAAIQNVRLLRTEHCIAKSYGTASAQVAGDPVMLEQVFFNVLENAVRYSEPGSPIEISVAEEGGFLVILIADQGPGIPERDREKVFERFNRGTGAVREGSGLGLSIAKGFLEAFGGSIRALPNETAKRGTVIRIMLRLIDGAAVP